MRNKFYTVNKTINGKEYVAQFSGISTALRCSDETYIEGTSTTSTEKVAKFIFENIIVEPTGLEADDFDTVEEFTEVLKFGKDVMNGKFRDQADEKPDTAKGRK